MPLAKNLLMDKRRATLQQAKIMIQASEQEQKIILNNLMMEATEAYWQWVQSYLVYNIYAAVIELNKKRVRLVAASYKLGERPAIDTAEAIAQLQNFEYLQNEALLNNQNAKVLLNTFLWKQNNEMYELPEDVRPDKKTEDLYDAVQFPELEKLILDAKTSHPELNMYTFKLDALTIDRKLKFQELLPKVDLKYNQLGKGYNIAAVNTKSIFSNNYRFGINFSAPLRLSAGRGEYKLAKLKINETKLQQSQKQTDIVYKVKKYYNQLVNYKTQVTLLQKTYNNYLQLQRGEETRFFNGESSLFLVNSRENKALETLIKLTEVTVNYNKTALGVQWASGQIWNLF
jgi:outer membrane protein TolC